MDLGFAVIDGDNEWDEDAGGKKDEDVSTGATASKPGAEQRDGHGNAAGGG